MPLKQATLTFTYHDDGEGRVRLDEVVILDGEQVEVLALVTAPGAPRDEAGLAAFVRRENIPLSSTCFLGFDRSQGNARWVLYPRPLPAPELPPPPPVEPRARGRRGAKKAAETPSLLED